MKKSNTLNASAVFEYLKDKALMTNVLAPDKIDAKGRMYFTKNEKSWCYIIKTRTGYSLAPTKVMMAEHPEIEWEYHKGWANEYRTELSFETVCELLA